MEWLSYIGSDVHKTIGSLFHPLIPQAAKDIHQQNLNRRLTYIEHILKDRHYLTGDVFTIADAYLFVMIGWEPYFKFDLSPYPNINKFHERVLRRSSVARMLEFFTSLYDKVQLPEFPNYK